MRLFIHLALYVTLFVVGGCAQTSTVCYYTNDLRQTPIPPSYNEGECKTFLNDEVRRLHAAVGLPQSADVELYAQPGRGKSFYDGEMRKVGIDAGTLADAIAAKDSRKLWAIRAVVAHEVGHHLLGHTRQDGTRPEREQAADRFAGGALFRMKATLDEAQAAVEMFWAPEDEKTHGTREARLRAVREGWLEARSEASTAIRAASYGRNLSAAGDLWDRREVYTARQVLESLMPRPGEDEIRGFEWFYHWKLCFGGTAQLRLNHNDEAYGAIAPSALALSPNGHYLAAVYNKGGSDTHTVIWDLRTEPPTSTCIGGGSPSVAWRSNDELLCANRERGVETPPQLAVYSLGTQTFKYVGPVVTEHIRRLALSPNKVLAAVAYYDRVDVVDLNSQIITPIDSGLVTAIEFTSDSQALLLGRWNEQQPAHARGQLSLFYLTEQRIQKDRLNGRFAIGEPPSRLRSLGQPTGWTARSIVSKSDGTLVLLVCSDDKLRYYDHDPEQYFEPPYLMDVEPHIKLAYEGTLGAATLVPGTDLAAVADAGTVLLMRFSGVNTPAVVGHVGGGSGKIISIVAGSSEYLYFGDDSLARTGTPIVEYLDGRIHRISLKTDLVRETYLPSPTPSDIKWNAATVAASHNGSVVAWPSADHGGSILVEWRAGGTPGVMWIPPEARPHLLAMNSAGTRLALGFRGQPDAESATFIVYDIVNRRQLLRYEADDPPLFALGFSGNGERVGILTDSHVRLWDISTLRGLSEAPRWVVGPEEVPDGFAGAMALDTNGARIGVTVGKGTDPRSDLILLGVEDRALDLPLRNKSDLIGGLAFSQDGLYLASGGIDGSVTLWHTQGAFRPAVLRNPGAYTPALTFSADGTRLFTGGWGSVPVTVWDPRTGSEVGRINNPEIELAQLWLSEDGSSLFGVSNSPNVAFTEWRAANRRQVWEYYDKEWERNPNSVASSLAVVLCRWDELLTLGLEQPARAKSIVNEACDRLKLIDADIDAEQRTWAEEFRLRLVLNERRRLDMKVGEGNGGLERQGFTPLTSKR